MQSFYTQELERSMAALEQLQQLPVAAPHSTAATELDRCLQLLLQRKISRLRLVLKQSDQLYLQFSYTRRQLKVTLPHLQQHLRNWLLHEEHVAVMLRMGFLMPPTASKLVLTLTGDTATLLQQVQLILLKLVFDIFHAPNFANETFLEYRESGGR